MRIELDSLLRCAERAIVIAEVLRNPREIPMRIGIARIGIAPYFAILLRPFQISRDVEFVIQENLELFEIADATSPLEGLSLTPRRQFRLPQFAIGARQPRMRHGKLGIERDGALE